MRDAVAEDEPFVLRLEELSLRKLSGKSYGHFVPRPGMGDEFPGNCRIIRYQNVDVGCLTVSTQGDRIQIEQLYLVPDVHGRGIGRWIVDDLLSQAAERGQSVQVTFLTTGNASSFFTAVGFRVVSETSKAITMEWSANLNSSPVAG